MCHARLAHEASRHHGTHARDERGTRNGGSSEQIWSIAVGDLPQLKAEVKGMLDDLE
jgi:hypothetical protein